MDRVMMLICVLVAGGALALTVMNGLNNPVEAKRVSLQERLGELPSRDASAAAAEFEWPFAQWRSEIEKKEKVWQGVVPPAILKPPPPKVAPPPAFASLLKGVQATKRGIGGKPVIIHPGKPRGELMDVGSSINGCEIVSFDAEQVTFKHYWPATQSTREFQMPRE